jgi:hypothetical protein
MQFRGEASNEFLKKHKGGEELLNKYLVDPRNNTNSSNIEVSSLRYPFKEFTWLFSYMTGLQTMAHVPRNIIYILHLVVREDDLIDWGHIISNEISF